jgi:hypothetical protein
MEAPTHLSTRSTFRELVSSSPWIISQGPPTQREQNSVSADALVSFELPVDFYSDVTVIDWRTNEEVDILDGAAAVIQEYWFKYRNYKQNKFRVVHEEFANNFALASAKRDAASKILKFWRAHVARRSWRRFRASVVAIQRKLRSYLAKLALKRLRDERDRHLATLRTEAELMRLNPLSWVQDFDQSEFNFRLQDVQERVSKFMRQRSQEEAALVGLVRDICSRIRTIPP